MKQTLAKLDQLVAESKVMWQRASLPSCDGHKACTLLGHTLTKFREKQTAVKLDRPKVDAMQIWSRFAASGHDLEVLSGLEFRALCCAEETAMRREFIAAIERSPDKLRRTRHLYALVHNYFLQWRVMENPTAVENLLWFSFVAFGGKNPVVQRWSAHRYLFSAQAAEVLAAEIFLSQKDIDRTLQNYYVGPTTKLALGVRNFVAAEAGRVFRQEEKKFRHQAWAIDFFNWTTGKVFTELTPADAFYSTISLFILSNFAHNSEQFRLNVIQYVRRHRKLGDPRLREYAPNWRSMPPEAAQCYLSWLARESIMFFFNTIVPDNSENRRRKDFWLQYHGKIKDFQVAVSEGDRWKIRAALGATERIAYSRVENSTASAFLMQFEGYGKNYVIVEFSETGNAAYILDLADFEDRDVTLRTPSFELRTHLRFDKTHRIIHNGDWEGKARYMLATEFGITP